MPRFARFQDESTHKIMLCISGVAVPRSSNVFGHASTVAVAHDVADAVAAVAAAGAVQERRVYPGSFADSVGGRGHSAALPRGFVCVGARPSQQVRRAECCVLDRDRDTPSNGHRIRSISSLFGCGWQC